MKVITGIAVGVLGLTGLAGLSGSGLAQAKSERTVEQYTCKDIMRETDSNRSASIAFLHGYLLGKSGNSKFDLEVLSKQTDAFIDLCLDKPGEKAEDAMKQVKK